MNQAQQQMINKIRAYMLKDASLGGRVEVEIKNESIDHGDTSDLVFFTLEIGNKNDEGTMLSVFGRKKRMFMIGKRGGVSLMTKVEGSDVKCYGYKQVTGFHKSVTN